MTDVQISLSDHYHIHVISANDLEERMQFIINNQPYC